MGVMSLKCGLKQWKTEFHNRLDDENSPQGLDELRI